MSRENKEKIIDNLEEIISNCSIGVLTDYRGLSVSEMTALRRRIQEAGGEYRVVKNTLARLAVARVDREELADSFEGPIAIAFGYSDITEIAKIITGYIRDTKLSLGIKGGFTEDRILSPADITTLSTIPSREVLLSQLLGQLNSPISSLVNVLASPFRGLAQVLQAQINKMEEA